jgi:BirA family biotin operon repressor/biotin-[acetyl-CoA-carboxylase] ligase
MDRDRYGDLLRPPLHPAALARALAGAAGPWREVTVVEVTGSTNADLVAAAAGGARAGAVLVAEEQTAGRGRLDRRWQLPARAGLTFSVLLRPVRSPVAFGWLPLLVGLAAAEALSATAALDVRLKWPNDLVVESADSSLRKLGGVLAERTADAVVVGVGVNVTATRAELPVAAEGALDATSVLLEGGALTDREPLLRAVLRAVAARVEQWDDGADGHAAGDRELAEAYRARCTTLGRTVRVERPGGALLTGLATGVDDGGSLLVQPAGAPPPPPVTVSAGDVVHLRAAPDMPR